MTATQHADLDSTRVDLISRGMADPHVAAALAAYREAALRVPMPSQVTTTPVRYSTSGNL